VSDHPNDPLAIAADMLAELRRLIEALDRRVPRLERLGEEQIARDAAALRERAANLISQIEVAAASRKSVNPSS
jgi:hypothetical protein